jgi:regulatory protein
MTNEDLLEKYYYRALNFLSYRPRSSQEIKHYLKKVCPEKYLTQPIYDRLQKEGYLDDRKFASWWVDQRLTFRLRGPQMLKYELLNKGVAKTIIDEVLSTINNKQLTTSMKSIIQKKIKLYSHLPPAKLKQKLYSYLARRGFDFNMIKNTIDEALKK